MCKAADMPTRDGDGWQLESGVERTWRLRTPSRFRTNHAPHRARVTDCVAARGEGYAMGRRGTTARETAGRGPMRNRTGRLCVSVLISSCAALSLTFASAHGNQQGGHHGRSHGNAVKGRHKGHGPLPHRRHAAHLKHVFVIVLENHSKDGVIGDPNTPAITALAKRYARRGRYFGVTHPSEPNYIAMTAGDNFAINNDNPANRFDAPNIVDQFEAAGKTWGAYMESMPTAGYLGDFAPGTTALYASKHNPFVLFTDIRNNPARLAKDKPYTALSADLNGREKSIPDFVYIVPNQCHDMHGGVSTQIAPVAAMAVRARSGREPATTPTTRVAQAEGRRVRRSSRAKNTIMSSKAWRGNSAIFVVADESDFNGATRPKRAAGPTPWAAATRLCCRPGATRGPCRRPGRAACMAAVSHPR